MKSMNKLDVIEKINRNEMTLSFSSLKEFAKSPLHFIKYKTEEKEQTQAMKIGKAFHVAILEPDKFNTEYSVLLTDMLPFPDKDFRNTENKKAKEQFILESANKTILTEAEYSDIKQYCNIINLNQISKSLLSKVTKTEVKIEYTFNGLNFIGYIDGTGSGLIVDLKKCADASPSTIKRTYFKDKWNLQGYLYCHAIDDFAAFYNIAVDLESVTVVSYSSETKEKSYNELLRLTDAFKRCVDGNLWESGYEFWCENEKGIYTI